MKKQTDLEILAQKKREIEILAERLKDATTPTTPTIPNEIELAERRIADGEAKIAAIKKELGTDKRTEITSRAQGVHTSVNAIVATISAEYDEKLKRL